VVTSDAGPASTRSVSRAGRFSTLGVRAWGAGSIRVVDDEIDASGRICSGGVPTVCVSGGFLR